MNDKPPKGAAYMCFTPTYDVVCAKREFFTRHAHKPRYAWVEKHLLWLGPIEKGETQ